MLHGLIAWMLWLAGETVWGPITQLYDGLLPMAIFSVMALIFAWWAVRDLLPPASVTKCGVRLTDAQNMRFIAVEEIYSLAPISPNHMAWHLMWPATPWHLLTKPDSLRDWWCIVTKSGVSYFRSADAEVMKQFVVADHMPTREKKFEQKTRLPEIPLTLNKIQPFRFFFPWQFEVAVCSLVLLDSSLLFPFALYGIGRIARSVWQSRRDSAWRRVNVRTGAAAPAHFSSTTNVDNRELSANSSQVQAVSVSIISPGRSVSEPSDGKIFMPWRWSAWLLLRGPSALLGQFRHLLGMTYRLASQALTGTAWLLLRAPSQIARVFGLAVSLWQTVLLTLVGWAAAVLLSFPLSVLVAKPQATLWHEAWMVRAVLWRSSQDESARQATAMLGKAWSESDVAAVRAVLKGGAVDGIFHLAGWQLERKLARACRDAVPEIPGIRLQLDEDIDATALLREVACNVSQGHLQSELLADAYRRSGGDLDIHVAVGSGDPELLPLALKNDGVPETRDWQGRTPLLLALDLAAGGGERRPGWLRIAQLLQQRGADLLAIDHTGRSASYFAAQAGLSGSALKPYLVGTKAQAASALGATLMHAAAASGEVATLSDVFDLVWLDPTTRTIDGRSALHFARGGAMVRALFQLGLDPDLRDGRGRLPLHAAILAGDRAAALALANITLAPQAKDNFGRTPLDYAPSAARETVGGKSSNDADRDWHELALRIAKRTRI